jgi:hypothetical protein
VTRLKSATEKGEENSKALMNYTKDAKPFVNLLLLAPLSDGKGKARYYLGGEGRWIVVRWLWRGGSGGV